MIRLRCGRRGRLRGVLSDGLSVPSRVAVLLRTIFKSEQY
jgi:hypothetical protein